MCSTSTAGISFRDGNLISSADILLVLRFLPKVPLALGKVR